MVVMSVVRKLDNKSSVANEVAHTETTGKTF